MKNVIKSSITSAIIGLTAFLSPAWAEPAASAERLVRLNIPVRVEGDLSRVTDGIWLYCRARVWEDPFFKAEWTAQVSAPGATFAPNADDGTFLTTFEFVPSDLAAHTNTIPGIYYNIAINCELQKGAVIPAEQLKPDDIERTSRRDRRTGLPSAPAGPGSCNRIYVKFSIPEYVIRIPPKLETCR